MWLQMGGGEFWARFVMAALATWRITHLLASEDGPADVFFKMRAGLGHGFWGKLMDCFYCLSLWIAAPFAFLVSGDLTTAAVVWFAVSGLACLLERATAPAIQIEQTHLK